jgi:hypothetical protein
MSPYYGAAPSHTVVLYSVTSNWRCQTIQNRGYRHPELRRVPTVDICSQIYGAGSGYTLQKADMLLRHETRPWLTSDRPGLRRPRAQPSGRQRRGRMRLTEQDGHTWEGYRKNTATFHAVPPARVRPPPATLRPLGPTPGGGPPAPRGPPGAGLARAGPEAPPPAAGPPWREPGRQRGWGGAGGTAARARPLPPLAPTPLSPPRPRPRSPPAHPRAGAAAWRRQRWPPDGGGGPCAAWVMGRQRRWGGGGGLSNSQAPGELWP